MLTCLGAADPRSQPCAPMQGWRALPSNPSQVWRGRQGEVWPVQALLSWNIRGPWPWSHGPLCTPKPGTQRAPPRCEERVWVVGASPIHTPLTPSLTRAAPGTPTFSGHCLAPCSLCFLSVQAGPLCNNPVDHVQPSGGIREYIGIQFCPWFERVL